MGLFEHGRRVFHVSPNKRSGFPERHLAGILRRLDFGLLRRLRLAGVRETEMPDSFDKAIFSVIILVI